jgi:hypothetical protein
VEEVAERFPVFLDGLRKLCSYRAIEASYAALPSHASRSADAVHPARLPRRLLAAVDEARAALVLQREAVLLGPTSASGASVRCGGGGRIVQLLRVADGEAGGGRRQGLMAASCVVGAGGELLYMDHTPAGLGADQAACLGRLVPRSSVCRVLREAEIHAEYAGLDGDGGRRLFGCAFLLFPPAGEAFAAAAGGAGPDATAYHSSPLAGGSGWGLGSGDGRQAGREVVLLASSLEAFSSFRAAARDWLAAHERLPALLQQAQVELASSETSSDLDSAQLPLPALPGEQYAGRSEGWEESGYHYRSAGPADGGGDGGVRRSSVEAQAKRRQSSVGEDGFSFVDSGGRGHSVAVRDDGAGGHAQRDGCKQAAEKLEGGRGVKGAVEAALREALAAQDAAERTVKMLRAVLEEMNAPSSPGPSMARPVGGRCGA